MKLFAQLTKVDEEKRLVFGRAADETVDKSAEVFDYTKSKPHFEKWSAAISADTDGKSLGNLRAMHGKVAAGKLTDIYFDDAARAIDVCAKVVDDNEWSKVLEGVYTGFSIGGSYGEKSVEKVDGQDITRYVAIPSEISLVDRPCNPTAKFFQVQKADGSTAEVEFHPAAGEDEDLGKVTDATVEGTPEQVDELTKLMVEKSMSLGAVIALIKGQACAEPDGDETLSPEEKKAKAEAAAKAAAEAEEAEKLAKAAKEAELAKLAEGDLAKTEEQLQKLVAEAVAPLQKALDEATEKIKKLEEQPAPTRVAVRAVSKVDDTGGTPGNEPTEQDLVKDADGNVHVAASLIKQAFASGGQPLHMPR